jgi:hypothetical protein
MNKLRYLFFGILKYFSQKKCPVCSSNHNRVVDTKYFVTRLLECYDCNILFRHPSDSPDFNKVFYQEDYKQKKCLVTTLPNEEELKKMVENNFVNTDRNADRVINTLKLLYPEKEFRFLKMIDYGSSWGYISYQLIQKGIEVESFEISEPRAMFGNSRLQLNIKISENELTPGKDIFFSSHVIEHLPNPRLMIAKARELLKEDGFFLCFCPNGSEEYFKNNMKAFHSSWGLVHPFFLNKNFFLKQYSKNPYYIGSKINPDGIKKMLNNEQYVDNISGEELLIISRPNVNL